jgi:acetyl esterase/lipase
MKLILFGEFTMRLTVCSLLITAVSVVGAEPPEIPLWAHGAPGSEGLTLKEAVENVGKERSERRITNVTNPTISVYVPEKNKATGAAIIVAPGGGHRHITYDNEGHFVAQWLQSIGVTGVVLKYRLARSEGNPFQVEDHVLKDAQRAIRMVRARAKEWSVDPSRVGILGFSAGGELAALAATRYDSGIEGADDPIEREKSRPDFQVLLYPGIPKDARVNKDMPPTFLCAAHDDRPNISEGLAEYYLAVKRSGVPVELHLYTGGGHGFGMRNRPQFAISTWPARLQDWLNTRGLLARRHDPTTNK